MPHNSAVDDIMTEMLIFELAVAVWPDDALLCGMKGGLL